MSYYQDTNGNLHCLSGSDIANGGLVLLPPGSAEITDAQAAEIQAQQAALAAPAILKEQAQAALDKSDITILRCYENAVAIPALWQTYRTELRAIISGKSTETELPAKPAYPAGT